MMVWAGPVVVDMETVRLEMVGWDWSVMRRLIVGSGLEAEEKILEVRERVVYNYFIRIRFISCKSLACSM